MIDQFSSHETRTIIDMVDDLRELQIIEATEPPQIVVIGEQSAGKSSVLEVISQVRFPIKAGIRTRFATELAFQRSERESISVTIRRADGQPQNPRSWQQLDSQASFDKGTVAQIITAAEEPIGLSSPGNCPKDFSSNILCIEVAGPDICPLAFVDLPGLFHEEKEARHPKGGKLRMSWPKAT